MTHRLATVLAVAACAPTAMANDLWTETTDGDLSDDRLNPTALVTQPGDNFLFGSLGGMRGDGFVDRDYFSITIPAGFRLAQLILTDYLSNDPVAFIAIQPGPVFPNSPSTVRPGDLLGWLHMGSGDVGTDILPQMGQNGQGFVPPLPGSVYTFWAQQTGLATDWVANFVVQPVPTPAALGLAGPALAAMAARRRR
ncbi:MAG: hypothetical protein IBJ11_03860 [Phycisphaerales bacterium]|nr:hypothetical protein [Phycisphaerales bacterium]